MTHFHTNINIQTIIALFFLVICFVFLVLGFLLWRFAFLDGKNFHFSRTLGKVFVAASGILTVAAVLMLIYVRVTL